MKKVYFILFGFVSIISFHCQKEVSYIHYNRNPFLTGEVTIQGNISDETGSPAINVMIKSGEHVTTTDTRGYFRIVGSLDHSGVSMLTAEKDGYFKAYRSLIATSGVNQVMIKLVKKDLAGTLNSTTGGEVSLPNGSKISLPANGLVKASGETYTGTVYLYIAYIDPTSKDIAEIIPGSLMGDNKDGKRVSLTSYGMLAVQLESSIGEKLQIAPGNEATVTFLIPPSLQSSAPGSISLWYVDEQKGIWKEDGTAIKDRNKYVGRVSHFSFWNCDTESSAIILSMTLRSAAGTPMIYTEVRLTTAGGRMSSGWTDSLGRVSGLVSSDTTLLMEVIALPCNNAIYSRGVGPFNQSTDLGAIIVDTVSSITIRGRLVNCSNSVVTKGYAIVSVDNIPRYVVVDNTGSFRTDIFICPGSAPPCEVLGVDDAAHKQGFVTDFNIITPETNLGDISTCGASSEQFINYTVDGVDHSITSDVTDSIYGETDCCNAHIQAAYKADHISFAYPRNNGAGSFYMNYLAFAPFDSSLNLIQPFDVTVSNYPQNVGEFYEGHFSGQFTDYRAGALHNVNCTFRVRRRQ